MYRLLRWKVGDEDLAREILQDFLVKALSRGITPEQRRGRFRDYLSKSLSNAVIDHYRREQRRPEQVIDCDMDSASEIQQKWRDAWTQTLLDRSWSELERQHLSQPAWAGYAVLKIATENPTLDSEAAAGLATRQLKRPYTAAAYRQQLSRARRRFAEVLLGEIRMTLGGTDEDSLWDEVRQLGLMPYLQELRDLGDI